MPTIDVVTQAVASLRKALGGDGESPAYVETIPKTGYRLLATIEWLPRKSVPAPSPAVRAQTRWRVFALIAGVALLATLSWSMAGWPVSQEPAPRPGLATVAVTGDIAYTLLTSRPGGETEPSLSPDGASVAYAMAPDAAQPAMAIFVQSTQPIPPRQLTTPPPGREVSRV